jgi:hypothetical protein
LLAERKLANCEQDRSKDGRPIERWVYTPDEINEINEISPGAEGDSSFNSFISSGREEPDAPDRVDVAQNNDHDHSDLVWRDAEELELNAS